MPGERMEAVVGEAAPAGEPHAARVAVDGDRPVVHHVDSVIRGEVPRSCDRSTRIRGSRRYRGSRRSSCSRRGSAPRASHQWRHPNPWRCSVPPSRRPATAAHDHDARASLREHRGRRQRRYRRCRRSRGCKESAAAQTALSVLLGHHASPLVHGSSSALWKWTARAAISASDRRPATICMTGCTLFPPLYACKAITKSSSGHPVIEGMPSSVPSVRWQVVHSPAR